MIRLCAMALIALVATGLMDDAGASTAEVPFAFKTSYRNVIKDPDGIWSGRDLSPPRDGTVTIYEYQLETPQGDWLISQIWNADCSATTCPTRLVVLDLDGKRRVLVDDMMRQVIPPDDPRFTALSQSKDQAPFARQPFLLTPDGKTLLNGDFSFVIGGNRP